jgi:hypothetical protein
MNPFQCSNLSRNFLEIVNLQKEHHWLVMQEPMDIDAVGESQEKMKNALEDLKNPLNMFVSLIEVGESIAFDEEGLQENLVQDKIKHRWQEVIQEIVNLTIEKGQRPKDLRSFSQLFENFASLQLLVPDVINKEAIKTNCQEIIPQFVDIYFNKLSSFEKDQKETTGSFSELDSIDNLSSLLKNLVNLKQTVFSNEEFEELLQQKGSQIDWETIMNHLDQKIKSEFKYDPQRMDQKVINDYLKIRANLGEILGEDKLTETFNEEWIRSYVVQVQFRLGAGLNEEELNELWIFKETLLFNKVYQYAQSLFYLKQSLPNHDVFDPQKGDDYWDNFRIRSNLRYDKTDRWHEFMAEVIKFGKVSPEKSGKIIKILGMFNFLESNKTIEKYLAE